MARLRYGLWLGRATGIGVAFSGGASYLDAGAPREAQVAARIAADEFGLPLRWVEDRARDTRENARFTVELLRSAGARSCACDPRLAHAARLARLRPGLRRGGHAGATDPAMTEQNRPENETWRAYLPSGMGLTKVRDTLREWLALMMAA